MFDLVEVAIPPVNKKIETTSLDYSSVLSDSTSPIETGNNLESDNQCNLDLAYWFKRYSGRKVGFTKTPEIYTDEHLQSALKGSFKKLDELTLYKANWNGHNASPANLHSAAACKRLLSVLNKYNIALKPQITLNTDGRVGLFWHEDDLYVSLSISASGLFSFFGESDSYGEEMGSDIPSRYPLPEALLKFITY